MMAALAISEDPAIYWHNWLNSVSRDAVSEGKPLPPFLRLFLVERIRPTPPLTQGDEPLVIVRRRASREGVRSTTHGLNHR